MTSKQLSKIIAGLASDKKAEEIVILEMKDVVNFCDYFVICSGTTDRHVGGISDNIEDGLHELGIKSKLKQGVKKSDWVVFDLGDVVTHVFQKQSRKFYALEYLWQEAKRIELE
ncbi:MAG: ribosome silencing factor [Candidatus Omnitrophica bacterium]|nr:ribosome silencing factor [Candidatus Omnitrophota bacterium]MBU1997484.1 ribosome silencing factor [Candidatus Omnitrophota bacterium]MBU4334530.1 ribosome silencing factor [Candidatus Omnitrophota bacterium]